MAPKTDPNGLLEWDGNKENLPPENTLFIFREKVLYWETCTCGCLLPNVMSEEGKTDMAITILARGAKTSKFPPAVVLAYLGATDEEVANAYDNPEALAALAEKLVKADPIKTGIISREEFDELMRYMFRYAQTVLGKMLPAMLGYQAGMGSTTDRLSPPQGNIVYPFRGSAGQSKN